MSQQKIIFHHIPKTGGTTLAALLDGLFDVDDIHPYESYHQTDENLEVEELTALLSQARPYQLYRGHLTAPAFSSFNDTYMRITILRNPYTRILSAYNHFRVKTEEAVQGAPIAYQELAAAARKYELGHFLETEVSLMRPFFDNKQTRMLSGAISKHTLDRGDLDLAMRTIDKVDLVGLTEHFNSFVHLLFYRLDIDKPKKVQSLNVGSYDFSGHYQNHEKLHDFTKYDTALYRYAQAKFEKLLVEYLEKSRSRQHIQKPSTSAHILINMTMGFQCEGFHVREGLDTAVPWRWTGPSKVSKVLISLEEDNDYKVVISIISVIDFKIIEELQLSLNGHALASKYEGVYDGLHKISAHVQRDWISPYHVDELKLEVPFTIAHADVEPETKDYRQKGVAITLIELSKIEAL